MAGEFDERFESLEGLIQRTMGGVDEMGLEMRDLRSEIRTHSFRFDKLDARFDKVDRAFAFVSGQQNDVISKVIEIRKELTITSSANNDQHTKIIEIWNRLADIQGTFKFMDERVINIEMEVKNLQNLIDGIILKMDAKLDVQANIEEIDRRITKIEERLAA